MTTPKLTAEASLYKTRGHYLTGSNRHAVNLPAVTISAIYPAMDEVIEVFGCSPGFLQLGEGENMVCIPDPSWAGGGGSAGETEPFETGEGKGGGKGKGKSGGKSRSKRIRRGSNLGRNCQGKDVGGDPVKAELECAAKRKGNDWRTLRCFDNPDGTVDAVCCHMDPHGKSMLCISDIEQVS